MVIIIINYTYKAIIIVLIYKMENNTPDENLYDIKRIQVFKNIRSKFYYFNLVIMSLFACPSFTKSIKRYIETKFKIPILHMLINDKLNDKEEQIKQIFLEIINNYGPFRYYEFVIFLIYITHQKAELLSKIYNEIQSNYITFYIKLVAVCLAFYYFSEISYSTIDEDYTKTFKHKPYELSLNTIFDENYFMDFIEQDIYVILYTGQTEFRAYNVIYRTFVNLLRNASKYNEKIKNISNLFGDIIYQFDLNMRLQSPSRLEFAYNASKILFVFNDMNDYILKKYKDIDPMYILKFPEFININVQKQVGKKKFTTKWLRYVLVVMYFTMGNYNGFNDYDNIIIRFYKDNKHKYYRINYNNMIECDNNEKLVVEDIKITKHTPSIYDRCDDFQDFDRYAIMCIYHAYKWL